MTKHTQPRALRSSAVSLAIAGMLMVGSVYAGKIDNTNNTDAVNQLGACGVDDLATPDIDESKITACIGAWNLGNVEVRSVKTETGEEATGLLDYLTGLYKAMVEGDSFVSVVKSAGGDTGEIMARITGKDWPVGEPTAIKAVNGDTKTKNGKPQNCLINSSYLGAKDSASGVDAYLDSANPEPVLCSSGFQSHKRFKVAMQPATVATKANGADGEAIDMVFNVADGGGLTPYQVFSKINNYTDKRLKGYKIVVGTGLGSAFVPASDTMNGGVGADKLHISLGIGEGGTTTGGGGGGSVFTPDGSDLFDVADGLANFSYGLFGKAIPPKDGEPSRFPNNGFFDDTRAGFDVEQSCASGTCATVPNPADANFPALIQSDTIASTNAFASNYTTLFGDWLPSKWEPSGVFFDDDNDPNTDAVLQAWWDGSQWMGNNDGGFTPIPQATLESWGQDPLYAISKIEDVLNLGINYIVKVGDDLDNDETTSSSTFTIRIIPVVADNQDEPTFLAVAAPTELPTPAAPPVASTDDGGGCSAATSQRPVDPVLPMLAALGLVGWGLRRARRH